MANNLDQSVVQLFEGVAGKREGIRKDVLRQTLVGNSIGSMAETLGISVTEVRLAQDAIFRQAGVKDRFELFQKLLNSVIE